MRRLILKNLLKICITFAVILSLCEVTSFHSRDFKQSRPVEAAVSEPESQYIPPNLDYSSMIKDIKKEEGIEADEEPKTAAADKDTDYQSGSPSEYMNIAMQYVREAMAVSDESEKRFKVLKAFYFYKEYLKHYPGNLEALLGAGAMATYLGKEDEAKNILMEAYATYPANPRVHKALGDYSFKFSNFNNAIEYYNLSLSSGNLKDYATNLATAVCYEKLGDKERAIVYYKAALYLNPDSELARERIEMYEIMEQDGYQADTRKYDGAKVPESEDTELEDLIFDASQIK